VKIVALLYLLVAQYGNQSSPVPLQVYQEAAQCSSAATHAYETQVAKGITWNIGFACIEIEQHDYSWMVPTIKQ
jgi:hypothetical protein